MNRKPILTAVLATLVSVSAPLFAGQPTTAGASDGDLTVTLQAVTELVSQRQQIRNDLDMMVAPVKSRASLAAYVSSTRADESPLDVLAPAARERFVDSLTFGKSGLSSYSYQELTSANLTASQIYTILALFGVQHTITLIDDARVESSMDAKIMKMQGNPGMRQADHKGYECSGRATCSSSIGDICTSNC